MNLDNTKTAYRLFMEHALEGQIIVRSIVRLVAKSKIRRQPFFDKHIAERYERSKIVEIRKPTRYTS